MDELIKGYQIGVSIQADFEHNTWIFEMQEGFSVSKGEYLIIKKEDFEKLNRWRKIEEELPGDQKIVIVKTDLSCFATAYYHGVDSGWIIYGDDAYREFGNITEWKPID